MVLGPAGWSWKGVAALVFSVAAFAGVLAGVGAALTVHSCRLRQALWPAVNRLCDEHQTILQRPSPCSAADAPVDTARCAEDVHALARPQVLLLARRRDAAGPPATQQLALALEAESVESTSTQVGRKTAEQFALADGDAAKVTDAMLLAYAGLQSSTAAAASVNYSM